MTNRRRPLQRGSRSRPGGSPGERLLVMASVGLVVVMIGVVVVIVVRHGTNASEARCGPAIVEPIDPQSSQHLLPTSREPDYRGEAPTSGPHLMGVAIQGPVDEPISKPLQVGILQAGSVLIQYPPGADPDQVTRLRNLAGPDVVVAPNPAIEAVVATAWGRRLDCADGDVATLSSFVAQYAGLGPRMGVAG